MKLKPSRQLLSQRDDYKWFVLATLVLGTFLTVIDLSSLNVALPTIGTYFNADLSSIQWAVIANALTVTVLLLPMGRLGDIIGRRNIWMVGFSVFIVGSILAASSFNLPMLIVSRALQGTGAAMIQANSMAMALSVFPPTERGKVIGLNMSAVGTGGIVGPAIGGLLVSEMGWRSIFLITSAVGVIAIIAAFLILDPRRFNPEQGNGHRPPFDWVGSILSGIALLLFLLIFTNGNQLGWTSTLILTGAVACAVIVITFTRWELRSPSPLFDLTLFKRKVLSMGAAAAWVSFMGTASVMFIMPFYFQRVLGYTPKEVGLIMIPGSLCMALVAPIAGRLSDRFGWRWFTIGGLALSMSAVLTLSTTLTIASPLTLIIPLLMLRFVGHALFNSPNASSIFSVVKPSRYGAVSALIPVLRNSGSVTGIAVVAMVVVTTMGSMGFEPSLDAVTAGNDGVAEAFVEGARRAFIVLSGFFFLAFIFSVVNSESSRSTQEMEGKQPSQKTDGDSP
ncbi:MFS transporter [Dehalococcoidia bacterium]|nr:MFS transporter [Dehalococcoidia bacterium]